MRTRLLLIENSAPETMAHFAKQQGWEIQNDFEVHCSAEGVSHPQETEWSVPGTSSTVHWIRDHELGCQYISVQGSAHKALADKLRQHFELASLSELLSSIDGSEEQQMAAARGVAVLSFEPANCESNEAFCRLLSSIFPKVRCFALLAQDYRPSRALLPHIEALQEDPDPSVRQKAVEVYGTFII